MAPRPSGIPHLDRVLGGGVPAGDTLLVLGPAGSGKTTLALQMAFHAATDGRGDAPERSERHLQVMKLRGQGLDLEGPLREGTIVFARHSPVDLSVDALVQSFDEALRGSDFQRFVLDGIVELTEAIAEEAGAGRSYRFSPSCCARTESLPSCPCRYPRSWGRSWSWRARPSRPSHRT